LCGYGAGRLPVGHCCGGAGAPVRQFPALSIVPEHGGAATEVVVTHWPLLSGVYTAGNVHSFVLAVVTQFPELSIVPGHGGAATEVVVTHWPPLYAAGSGHSFVLAVVTQFPELSIVPVVQCGSATHFSLPELPVNVKPTGH
jgi:hypothetical protein